MAEVRVLVGDRTGRLVAELEGELGPVSWRLNAAGKAPLWVAKTDPKATEDNLRFGNRLLIQFDNGLPDWGGAIDPPRKWEEDRIEVTAYSGESLLGWRQTDRGRYFSSATVGTIFEKLILEANAIRDTGVAFGSAWGGGGTHSPEWHFRDLLEICQDSLARRLEDADFGVSAAESGGRIAFTAHLWERRGSVKSGVALLEGHNVTRPRLVEQGRIVNSWDLAGEGTTWGEDRLTSHAQSDESIAEYGLREGSRVYADTSVQATLDQTAINLLAESAQPRNIVTLEAVDLAPAAFASYDVGDSIRVTLPSYGFGGYDHLVRVLTREYRPVDGSCSLVVEEDD